MTAVDHAGRPADYPQFCRELRVAGVTADIRYLCRPESRPINATKIARPEEITAAHAEGLEVCLVWQDTKLDALRGAPGGQMDGEEARRQAEQLGAPPGTWIYFAAADYDAPSSDHDTIAAYLSAAQDALGPYRAASYGKNTVGRMLLDRHLTAGHWQSYGFSRPVGVVEPWAVMYQRREQRTFAGVVCDINDVLGEHGGWGSPVDLVTLLRDAGIPAVRDERVPPRAGAFTPVGIMLHHTATAGSALATVKTGRTDLAGPLCDVNITRQGVINVVCDGRANHAGAGSSTVLGDVRSNRAVTQDAGRRGLADDTNGNQFFYGIEVDNNGTGEPLPPAQLDAIVVVCRTLCAHYGWPATRVIHHRQWTRRKIDMFWRGDIAALINEEDDMTPAQAKQLQDIHDMVDVIKNGAAAYGVEATPVSTSLTHRLLIKVADKLGVPTS